MIFSLHKLKVVTFFDIRAHRIGLRVRLHPTVKFLVLGFTHAGRVIANLNYSTFLARRAFLFLFGALSRYAHPAVVLGWRYYDYPEVYKYLSYNMLTHVRSWIPGLFTNWEKVSTTALRAEGSLEEIGMIFQFPDVMLLFGANDRMGFIPREAQIIKMPSIMPSEAAVSFNAVNYFIPSDYKRARPTEFFFRLFYSVREEALSFRHLRYFSIFKQSISVIYSRRSLLKKLAFLKTSSLVNLFTSVGSFYSPLPVGAGGLPTKNLFPFLGYFSFGYLSKRLSSMFFLKVILSDLSTKRGRISFLKKNVKTFKESGSSVSGYKTLNNLFRSSFFPGRAAASRYEWLKSRRSRRSSSYHRKNIRLSALRRLIHQDNWSSVSPYTLDTLSSLANSIDVDTGLVASVPKRADESSPLYWEANSDFFEALGNPPVFKDDYEDENKLAATLTDSEMRAEADYFSKKDERDRKEKERLAKIGPPPFTNTFSFSNFKDYEFLKLRYPQFSKSALSFRGSFRTRPIEVPKKFPDFLDFLQFKNPSTASVAKKGERFFRLLTRRLLAKAIVKSRAAPFTSPLVRRYWPFTYRFRRKLQVRKFRRLRRRRNAFLRYFKTASKYSPPVRKKSRSPLTDIFKAPASKFSRRLLGPSGLREVFGPPKPSKFLSSKILKSSRLHSSFLKRFDFRESGGISTKNFKNSAYLNPISLKRITRFTGLSLATKQQDYFLLPIKSLRPTLGLAKVKKSLLNRKKISRAVFRIGKFNVSNKPNSSEFKIPEQASSYRAKLAAERAAALPNRKLPYSIVYRKELGLQKLVGVRKLYRTYKRVLKAPLKKK